MANNYTGKLYFGVTLYAQIRNNLETPTFILAPLNIVIYLFSATYTTIIKKQFKKN